MQPGCNNGSTASPAAPARIPRVARRHDHDHAHPRAPWLDRLGIGVSITCAVHCVGAAILAAAPAFAATASPALGERFETAESALLWVALGIGALALVPAYLREHRRPLPLALFTGGLACLVASRLIDASGLEIAGTVAGVALVSSAHLLNIRAHRAAH